ncbi:MAG TPA: AN1-type zinc finger domain-containing protein [Nitrosopumilaceae archaeon]|nr:AN1-type zinc finger domain-containing protein [Nitrosopumilaceae archaeon]
MQLTPCQYCGEMSDLPFECSYCKDSFCHEHRLPEEHRCIKLSLIRAKRFGQKNVIRDGNTQRPSILRRMFSRFGI